MNKKGYINIMGICFIIIALIVLYMCVNLVSPETTWYLRNVIFVKG